jgi:V8-like Glu-specific endopeptidase
MKKLALASAIAAACVIAAPSVEAQTRANTPERIKRLSAPKVVKFNPPPAEVDVFGGNVGRTLRNARQMRMPSVRLRSITLGAPRPESVRQPKTLLGVEQASAAGPEGRALVPNVNQGQAPFNAVGKLGAKFGTSVGTCTAQFVAEGVLLTAAHCIQDPDSGDFAEQVVFLQQYRAGKQTAVFRGVCGGAPAGFMEGEQFERYGYDYALVVVDKPQRKGIGLGILTDYDPGQVAPVVAVGYPGAMANGEVMQVVSGEVKIVTADGIPENSLVVLVHGVKDFTQGSSGGAWISKPSSRPGRGVNQAIAVVSFGSPDLPGMSFAAYLTAEKLEELIETTKQSCGVQ